MRPSHLMVLIVVESLLATAQGTAQGLGDAAKIEQKRRAGAAAPAKTYTQDDLRGLPPVANEGASSSATSGSTSSATHAAPQASPKSSDYEAEKRAQDEKTWRARAAAARERVELARKKYETLAPMNVAPDRPGEYIDFEGMKAAAKAEYEVAQKALDDLHDEARRASVPPGWLR